MEQFITIILLMILFGTSHGQDSHSEIDYKDAEHEQQWLRQKVLNELLNTEQEKTQLNQEDFKEKSSSLSNVLKALTSQFLPSIFDVTQQLQKQFDHLESLLQKPCQEENKIIKVRTKIQNIIESLNPLLESYDEQHTLQNGSKPRTYGKYISIKNKIKDSPLKSPSINELTSNITKKIYELKKQTNNLQSFLQEPCQEGYDKVIEEKNIVKKIIDSLSQELEEIEEEPILRNSYSEYDKPKIYDKYSYNVPQIQENANLSIINPRDRNREVMFDDEKKKSENVICQLRKLKPNIISNKNNALKSNFSRRISIGGVPLELGIKRVPVQRDDTTPEIIQKALKEYQNKEYQNVKCLNKTKAIVYDASL